MFVSFRILETKTLEYLILNWFHAIFYVEIALKRQFWLSGPLCSTHVDHMRVIWPNKFWGIVSIYLKSLPPKYRVQKFKTHNHLHISFQKWNNICLNFNFNFILDFCFHSFHYLWYLRNTSSLHYPGNKHGLFFKYKAYSSMLLKVIHNFEHCVEFGVFSRKHDRSKSLLKRYFKHHFNQCSKTPMTILHKCFVDDTNKWKI